MWIWTSNEKEERKIRVRAECFTASVKCKQELPWSACSKETLFIQSKSVSVGEAKSVCLGSSGNLGGQKNLGSYSCRSSQCAVGVPLCCPVQWSSHRSAPRNFILCFLLGLTGRVHIWKSCLDYGKSKCQHSDVSLVPKSRSWGV